MSEVKTASHISQKKAIQLIRRAGSINNKYGNGGRKKKGGHAPRPITLAKLHFTEARDEK